MVVTTRTRADAEHGVEGGDVQDGVVPGTFDAGTVVGMDGVQPAVDEVGLQVLPGEGAPLGAVLVDLAAGARRPDDLVSGLEQGAQALFASVRGVLVVTGGDERDVFVTAGRVVDREPGEVPGVPFGGAVTSAHGLAALAHRRQGRGLSGGAGGVAALFQDLTRGTSQAAFGGTAEDGGHTRIDRSEDVVGTE